DDVIDGGDGDDILYGTVPGFDLGRGGVPYDDVVELYDAVAHWKLGETSGSVAQDSSGNGNDGGYAGGVGLGSPGILSGDSAANFDGHNDHVVIAHDDTFDMNEGTVQMWFNTDNAGKTQGLFSKDSSGFDSGGHLTARIVGNDVEIRLQSGDQSFTVRTTGDVIQSGEWYMLSFSFGPEGMKLYLNGELMDTNGYTGGLDDSSGGAGNTEPWVLGANSWGSGNGTAYPLQDYFDGRIDEVTIFGDALNDYAVQDIYESGIKGDDFTPVSDVDIIIGGGGSDQLFGSEDDDNLSGGTGDDFLDGAQGLGDLLDGGEGNDTLIDLDGVLAAHGGSGDDKITIAFDSAWDDDDNPGTGPKADNRISGGAGADIISVTMASMAFVLHLSTDSGDAEANDDGDDELTLNGSYGQSLIYLNGGNDVFDATAATGGALADTVFGGSGADRILGGLGDDV
ncbi:MAG: LamG-like jellyroll fold domain-containing protein, partial [Alphaproteobacteria bacterium]